MKPVYQTIIGKDGNCWTACIATLLGVNIEAVPHFLKLHGPTAVKETRQWLRKRHNVGLLTVYLKGNEENGIIWQADAGTRCIVSIPSPNIKGGYHAVIAEVDEHELNLRFIFDPREDGKSCVATSGYFKKAYRPLAAHFFVA